MLNEKESFTAIDLFSGCGGLSCGLKAAGFHVVAGIEIDELAVRSYVLNHPNTLIVQDDIKNIKFKELLADVGIDQIDLVAGCPPCQGFSSLRRKNKRGAKRDTRNSLLKEFLRAVVELYPKVILLENVPALRDYYLFDNFKSALGKMGYRLKIEVLDAASYGVPQRRKRLVLLGSRIGEPMLPQPQFDRVTVRDAIGFLPAQIMQRDSLHRVYSRHSQRISEMIAAIPQDGGSRKDLPERYTLNCHKEKSVGFTDVYGRMKWDDVSPTITGGCLNPSKGRFLHPTENRSITAREAALLQTFPMDYKFPEGASKEKIALMIGNALPPVFAKKQAESLMRLLRCSSYE